MYWSLILDVYGYGSNVSLVFDFMDTDLEVIIKDTRIIFTASHIKAYTLMTLLGLEYLHNNWILHRVRRNTALECPKMFPFRNTVFTKSKI
jgi:serine/threonine protein kinase